MIYCFDDCLLDIGRRELRRAGVLCPIEPQVFDLLHFLIVNRERVVSREEIFQKVWHGRIVSDSVLGNRINAARRAIGDDGAQQRMIRTLRRHGFRFIGAVAEETRPPVKLHESIIVGSRKLALVVLPVIVGPADEELAFIAKGIADDLTVALACTQSFDVIAPNCVYTDCADPGQFARGCGAAYAIICAIRRVSDQVRIIARLIDAFTGLHAWAQSYTQGLRARLADRDSITAQIAAAIEPHVFVAEAARSRRKPLHALDARECVLAALSLTTERTTQSYAAAENLLVRAIELDPTCARAYSVAAWYGGVQVLYAWKPPENRASALEAAQKAVLLDNYDPWGHFALGWALTQSRKPEQAIEEYQRALAINPYFREANSCLGLALGYAGRVEQALAVLDNGERLDAPEILVGLSNSARAGVYFCAEKPYEAVKAARRSLHEGRLIASQRQLIVNSALAGEMDEAQAALKRFSQMVPQLSLNSIAGSLPNIRDADLNRTLDAFRIMGVS